MEEQLNLLLEEAEDELQQLEQDSLGCVCREHEAFCEAGRRVPRFRQPHSKAFGCCLNFSAELYNSLHTTYTSNVLR